MSIVMKPTIHALAILMLLFAGCTRQQPAPTNSQRETVVISVAASTKDVLESLAEQFDRQADVKVNAGPSSGLATQILAGAPADLFLSASQEWADQVASAGLAVESTHLLTNRLVLIVPAGNPAGVHAPQDLATDRVKRIAMAGEEVPAGKYGNQALAKLDLLTLLTEEGRIVRGQDVRSALAFVERGEVEAGIVYATDAKVTKGVEVVHEFDPDTHDEIVYVLVLLKSADDKPAAGEFYQFLQSSDASSAYEQAGFLRID